MPPGVPTKVIAASCGLTAFVIAIVAGLSVSNPADTVLARALLCMLAVHILGLVIGAVGERTMIEAASRYRSLGSPASSRSPQSPSAPSAHAAGATPTPPDRI